MEVASKNQQKELVNVNNFWKWPTEWAQKANASQPTDIWKPEPWKWYGMMSASGYVTSAILLGSFTNQSVSMRNQNYYSVGMFIDLAPGTYTYFGEWDAPLQYRFYVLHYANMPNGNYLYAGFDLISHKLQQNVKDSFIVRENEICALLVDPATETEHTLTNIAIREGIG